jgi:hypothetical protein
MSTSVNKSWDIDALGVDKLSDHAAVRFQLRHIRLQLQHQLVYVACAASVLISVQ